MSSPATFKEVTRKAVVVALPPTVRLPVIVEEAEFTNNPPWTSNLVEGAIVPMPTLPLLSILIASAVEP